MWYQMVKVHGAQKHGKYDKIWLKNLRVMPNVKVFAMQGGQLDEHSSLQM